jgi:hypothetical protein
MADPVGNPAMTRSGAKRAPSPARPRRDRLYPLVVPAAALAVFALFALLWTTGLGPFAEAALRILGVKPGPLPFFDSEGLLAAVECHRRGIDVYLANPCDAWGRLDDYSPSWFALVPPGFGTAATAWVGATFDLLFIAALPLLIRPRRAGDLLVCAAAVLSPMTVLALERGNNDLLIFILVLGAALLQAAASRRWRLCSYAVIVAASLLKYYPAILLILALRERRRDALLVGAGTATAVALFVICEHAMIGPALANIPVLPYFTASFSARNLPFGLAAGVLALPAPGLFAVTLFALLSALALAWLRRAVLLLDSAGLDWDSSAAHLAAIGGLLMTGCFFAGQNDAYRGIFFLFALAGLLPLCHTAKTAAARRLLAWLVAAILFLMWGEFIHRAPLGILAPTPGFDAAMAIWALRELVWWWAIAGLGAVAWCHAKRLPLVCEGAAWRAKLLAAPDASIPGRAGHD